jgi:acyl-CoA hydrolase
VTVSVDTVHFRQPVEVGDLVSFLASVNYVGRSSMVVGMRVTSENVHNREVKHTATSYFTMVARSETGESVAVPPLILETHDDIRRFFAAMKRRELSKDVVRAMKAYEQADFDLKTNASELLGSERCVVQLSETNA